MELATDAVRVWRWLSAARLLCSWVVGSVVKLSIGPTQQLSVISHSFSASGDVQCALQSDRRPVSLLTGAAQCANRIFTLLFEYSLLGLVSMDLLLLIKMIVEILVLKLEKFAYRANSLLVESA